MRSLGTLLSARLPRVRLRVLHGSITVLLAGFLLLFAVSKDGTDRNGIDRAWSSLKDGFARISAYGVTLATGQSMTQVLPRDSLPGFLYIEAPQLYTRERLVNDRFRQANWLSKELERTTEKDDATRFGAPSQVEKRNQSTRFLVQMGEGALRPETESLSEESGKNPQPELDQLKLLERRISYRAELRNELMDTQLDDGHDLDGNTLYRLNFDAVALPWADSRANPGAAIFIVTAKQANGVDDAPDSKSDADIRQFVEDDVELLRSWQREMQVFLTSILRYRTEEFGRSGSLPNRTDPKEDIAFDWFLRVRLIESFLDLLADRVALVFDCDEGCDKATREFERVWNQPDPEKRRALRRDFLATWVGFGYRASEKSPDIDNPVWQASFRSAIRRAREVNNLRWRIGAGARAYSVDCLAALPNAHEVKTGRSPPPEYCARSLPDSNNLRAVVRLISVVGAMRDYPGQGDEKLFQISFDRKGSRGGPAGLTPLLQRFDKIVPTRGEIEAAGELWRSAGGRERLKHNSEDICLEESINAFEFGRCSFLNASAGRESEKMIARFIHARLKGDLPSYGAVERPVSGFLDVKLTGCGYTRCRFEIRKKKPYSQSQIEALLSAESEMPSRPVSAGDLTGGSPEKAAEQARCATDVVRYQNVYQKGSPDRFREKYAGNLTLNTVISKAEARAEVRSAFSELYAACRLRAWLDANRNDLVVYGISPRLRGEVVSQNAGNRLQLGGSGAIGNQSGPKINVERLREQQRSEASVKPMVIGFSQLAPAGLSLAKPRRETVFGWVVRSMQSPDGTWKAGHHRLAAVLSVPSWWKRLEFEVLACWSSPARARALGQDLLRVPTAICADDDQGRLDIEVSAGQGSGKAKAAQSSDAGIGALHGLKRKFRIQLPRRAEDVTARFNFDFIKAPYFEADWNDRIVRSPVALEIGRKGRVVLPGERLWRGTVVTLGEQPADKIVVLPDMKGVVAEFDCVNAPPGVDHIIRFKSQQGREQRENSGSLSADLTVWTAEGRTPLGTRAMLKPFVQRTAGEKPCFALN